jgi:hypothetical protein
MMFLHVLTGIDHLMTSNCEIQQVSRNRLGICQFMAWAEGAFGCTQTMDPDGLADQGQL